MNSKELDDLIRSKYQELDVPYAEGTWHRLRNTMDESAQPLKKNHNRKWLAAAASIVLFGGVWATVLYHYMDGEGEKVVQQVNQPKKSPLKENFLAEALPAVPANQPIEDLSRNFSSANAYSRYLNVPFNLPTDQAREEQYITKSTLFQKELETKPSLIRYSEPSLLANYVANNRQKDRQSLLAQNSASTDLPITQSGLAFQPNEEFSELDVKTGKRRSTNLGIAGGINNIGVNNNVGYAIAVVTETKVNDIISIDNAVAFGSTQENYNIQNTTVPKALTSLARSSSPAKVKLTGQMVYVSVAPSMGVKLGERIKVSAGMDVQRIIFNNLDEHNNIYTGYFSDASSEVIVATPIKWKHWDAGATAKASVQVVDNFEVGLLYRNGVINMIDGSPEMSAYRSYGQIILQYRIISNQKKH